MPSKIEWCHETINPFGWGCYGPGGTAEHPKRCGYCFAYRMARRNLRKCELCRQFVPHWHPDELKKPLHWKSPRRIFVASMSDPFGAWVSLWHLDDVLQMARETPQHRYLLLTKQPGNIRAKLYRPYDAEWNRPMSWGDNVPNAWLGCTLTGAEGEQDPSPYMRELQGMGWHVFVSIEPLLGPVNPDWYSWAEWVILGAQTGPGAVKPDEAWVTRIGLRRENVPIFVKDNMARQYPVMMRLRQYPDGLKVEGE